MPPTKTPKVRPLHSTHRDIVRHPSAGGTRGYSMSQRDNAMAIFDRGDENLYLFNELRIIRGSYVFYLLQHKILAFVKYGGDLSNNDFWCQHKEFFAIIKTHI